MKFGVLGWVGLGGDSSFWFMVVVWCLGAAWSEAVDAVASGESQFVQT